MHAEACFHLINHAVEPFSLTPWGQAWIKALPGSTFPVKDAVGWNIPIDIPHLGVVSPGWQSEMPGSSRKLGVVWVRGVLVYKGMQDFPSVEECLLRCDVGKVGDGRTL